MSEFKYSERIDAYLEGSMSTDERQRFEADLLSNEDLQAEFDASRAAQNAVEFMAFQGMLSRIKKEPPTKPIGNLANLNNNRFWLVFVLIGLASIVLFWVFLPSGKKEIEQGQQGVPSDSTHLQKELQTPEIDSLSLNPIPVITPKKEVTTPVPSHSEKYIALAKSVYESEPVTFANMRGSQPLPKNDPVFPAAKSFDDGQFEQALKLASDFNKGDAGYLQAREIAAHGNFKLGYYEKAAVIFQEVIKASGDAGERLEGYLLLSWLAAGKSQTASYKSLLNKIQKEPFHPAHEMVEKIKL